MSYEFYETFHILTIFVFFSLVGAQLLGGANKKWIKILMGVFSLLILVAGMGLLARIGGGFPPWVVAKIIIWLALSVSIPFLAGRLKKHRGTAWATALALGFVAIYLGVNHS